MDMKTSKSPVITRNLPPRLTVSLKTLMQMLDAGRSSVRRWLKQAGVQPIVMNDGPKSAIRYRWRDVEAWLESRDSVD
jgi:hypothetical protein